MESTFLAKLFIRVWFNMITEQEEYPYLHALLVLIEFLDFAGLGGVKGCCSDTGYNYVVFRTRGRYTLDRKNGRQIVRRLCSGNLRHDCIQESALCDGGSVVVWAGIHKGRKKRYGNWWLRMETSTSSCSWTFWKSTAFHAKEKLMETTFDCKTKTFAYRVAQK